ncbi:prion-like-(Q N-rich) domain-bearing 25, partial [Brachionus plicatilis]
MPTEKPFDDLNKVSRLKYQIWSSENENAKEFLDSETTTKQKINAKGLNRNQEHHLVNQYNVKQDQFNALKESSKFKIPIWLIAIICGIGILLLLGAIAAIFISIFAPKNYSTYNEKCDNATLTCDPSKNLFCSNGLCACSDSDFFWSTSSEICEYKKSYAQSCSSTSECFENNGLFCSTTASTCNCPATSVANMCECSTSTYFDDQTKKCVNRLTYGSSCMFDSQCTQTISLVCSSAGTCSCPTAQYYENFRCNTKGGYRDTCSSANECDETKGLTECLSAKCECPSGFYYDTDINQCNLAKTYGSSCTSDNECDETKNLECKIFWNPKTCNCKSGSWDYSD